MLPSSSRPRRGARRTHPTLGARGGGASRMVEGPPGADTARTGRLATSLCPARRDGGGGGRFPAPPSAAVDGHARAPTSQSVTGRARSSTSPARTGGAQLIAWKSPSPRPPYGTPMSMGACRGAGCGGTTPPWPPSTPSSASYATGGRAVGGLMPPSSIATNRDCGCGSKGGSHDTRVVDDDRGGRPLSRWCPPQLLSPLPPRSSPPPPPPSHPTPPLRPLPAAAAAAASPNSPA